MNSGQIYCIDTSALIAGFHRIYPYQVFLGLWEKIGNLADQGRLIAPEEVYQELAFQEDALFAWAKHRRNMFVAPDYRQLAFLTEIARDFPRLSQSKVSANTADPFVIALAKVKNCVVVSDERGGSDQHPKIPFICKHYDVAHISFLDIVLAEGWTFP